MYKFLFCVAIVFLEFTIKGCMFNGCEIIELPKSEKQYFKKNKIGNNQKFISNLDRQDTITVIRLFDSYSSCNRWELVDYQFNTIYIEFSSCLFRGKYYIDFSITESKKIERSFKFRDLYGYFYDDEINDCIDKIKISSFPDSLECHTFNTSNSASEYNGIIKSFSWSKEHGFLRYETKEGEVFELQK